MSTIILFCLAPNCGTEKHIPRGDDPVDAVLVEVDQCEKCAPGHHLQDASHYNAAGLLLLQTGPKVVAYNRALLNELIRNEIDFAMQLQDSDVGLCTVREDEEELVDA